MKHPLTHANSRPECIYILMALKHWKDFCLVGLVAVLAGCASKNDKNFDYVSSQIQKRTTHTLFSSPKPSDRRIPPGIIIEDGIFEDEAVAIALWNNPLFQENLSKLGLARADLAQAGMLSNPTLSVLFPLGPKQLEFAATFPLEAVWLRPRRVAIARLDAERVADGLVQSGLDLVRDVRAGLSDLALAKDRARLSREAVTLRERIAQITEARQRAGEGNELDNTAAQVEVLRGREEARRFEQEVNVVHERLVSLLGLTETSTNVVIPAPTASPPTELVLEDLEHRALAARPDLRASELAIEAAGKRAGLARAEIFALSGIIDANAQGKEGFEIGPGAQLPIPIFNQNQAGRTRAGAEIERAAWNYLGTRQRVILEVREAHARYQQASEALQGWRTKLVPSLEDLVRRSEKSYGLGEMSPLAVQENARQLLTARVRQAELAADLRRASAELERSVGTRLTPASK